jgi:hypothetical protein
MTIGKTHNIRLKLEMKDQTLGRWFTSFWSEAYHKQKGLWVAYPYFVCTGNMEITGTSKKDITDKLQADLDEYMTNPNAYMEKRGFKVMKEQPPNDTQANTVERRIDG